MIYTFVGSARNRIPKKATRLRTPKFEAAYGNHPRHHPHPKDDAPEHRSHLMTHNACDWINIKAKWGHQKLNNTRKTIGNTWIDEWIGCFVARIFVLRFTTKCGIGAFKKKRNVRQGEETCHAPALAWQWGRRRCWFLDRFPTTDSSRPGKQKWGSLSIYLQANTSKSQFVLTNTSCTL